MTEMRPYLAYVFSEAIRGHSNNDQVTFVQCCGRMAGNDEGLREGIVRQESVVAPFREQGICFSFGAGQHGYWNFVERQQNTQSGSPSSRTNNGCSIDQSKTV